MRVILKKNKTIDDIQYYQDDGFTLLGVSWTDEHLNEKYHILSKSGKRHDDVDCRLFDFDCRDVKPKI